MTNVLGFGNMPAAQAAPLVPLDFGATSFDCSRPSTCQISLKTNWPLSEVAHKYVSCTLQELRQTPPPQLFAKLGEPCIIGNYQYVCTQVLRLLVSLVLS